MHEGYEYDSESPGMRAALEKARGQGAGAAELDALMEKLRQTWGEDAPTVPVVPMAAGQQIEATTAAQGPSAPIPEAPDESWAKPPMSDPSAPPLPAPPPGPPPPVPPPDEPWARMKHDLRENETRPPGPDPLAAKMREAGWESRKTYATPAGKPDWEKLQGDLTDAEKAGAAGIAPEAAQEAAAQVGPDWSKLHGDVQAVDQAAAAKKAEEEKVAAAKKAAEAPKEAAGPDWARMQGDLQHAQHAAETRRTVAAMLHAAAPGFVPPANIGEGDIAAARAAIEVAQAQQRSEAERSRLKREGEEKLLTTAKDQAHRDPASPESQRARAALRPVFEMVGQVPQGFDGWSAADVEAHAKTLAPIAGLREREATTQAEKEKAEAAKKEAADKTAAEVHASLKQQHAAMLLDPRAKKLGLTPEMINGLDRPGTDKIQHLIDSQPKEKPVHAPAKPVTKLEDIQDPGTRNEVAAILRYDQLLSKVPARGGEQERIRRLVLQIDPNFDEVKAQARADVRHQQALAPDIIGIDTAREHIKTAKAAIPKNADVPFFNRMKKAIAENSGDPEFKPFTIAANFVGHEVAKTNNITDQAGKEEVIHQLSSVDSVPAMMATLDTWEELMKGKQHGRQMQLDKTAPPSHEPAKVSVRRVGGTIAVPMSAESASKMLLLKNDDGTPKYEEVK